MSEFDRLADAKWLLGVRDIRQGDESAPFKGDPVSEGIEETLDLRNYARAGQELELIEPEDAGYLRALAAEAFRVLRKYRRA